MEKARGDSATLKALGAGLQQQRAADLGDHPDEPGFPADGRMRQAGICAVWRRHRRASITFTAKTSCAKLCRASGCLAERMDRLLVVFNTYNENRGQRDGHALTALRV